MLLEEVGEELEGVLAGGLDLRQEHREVVEEGCPIRVFGSLQHLGHERRGVGFRGHLQLHIESIIGLKNIN